MASETRDRMIVGAARLLAERGLQETSFSEVLQRTGAPRGSIYHHFPEGKDQLVGSAIEFAGSHAMSLLEAKTGESAIAVTEYFLHVWREVLTRSQFQAGCSVLAVTVATDSPQLLQQAAGVFRAWRAQLARLLETGGLSATDAVRFATTLVASTEGAVVLARADQSLEPFELVAAELLERVRELRA